MDPRLNSTPQDLYLEFDGARLRYRDEGHGPALVLVHGWTFDLDMWEFQADALTPDYRVVRLPNTSTLLVQVICATSTIRARITRH
jgi:hypothetical protein